MKKKYLLYFFIFIPLFLLLHCSTFRPPSDTEKLNRVYSEAFTLFQCGEHTESLKKLNWVLERDSGYTKAYILRGVIYEMTGKYNAALADYNNVLKNDTTNYIAFYNRGNVFFAQEKYAEAIASYTRCLRQNSLFTQAYLNRANSYMHLKEYTGALADYKVYITRSDSQKNKIEQIIALLENEVSSPGEECSSFDQI